MHCGRTTQYRIGPEHRESSRLSASPEKLSMRFIEASHARHIVDPNVGQHIPAARGQRFPRLHQVSSLGLGLRFARDPAARERAQRRRNELPPARRAKNGS
jgi:hypothetical protein